MKANQSENNAQVWRITVDEKLADDMIRVLISQLAAGVKEFYDRNNDWEKEEEYIVRPATYIEEMGIPLSEAEKWPWAGLNEGQVFLSGHFEVISSEELPDKFAVNPEQENFLRIDKIIRKDIKRLYFEALGGGSIK